jgi:PAS domain S-box-containing protein
MGFFARSIRNRLLAVIITTALAVVVVHDLIAVREIHRMAMVAATTRLERVSDQLGQMLETQAQMIRRQVVPTANQPAIKAVIASPNDSAARAAALKVLASAAPTNVMGISVWSTGADPIVTTGRTPAVDSLRAQRLMRAAAGRDQGTIGPLMRMRDSLVYGTIVRVADSTRTLGYLVEWRAFAGNSKEGRRQLVELIGSDASIFVGNSEGDEWTDFAGFVSRPPVPLPKAGAPMTVTSYERPRSGNQLAAIRALAGTPWTLVIEFPRDRIVSPVRSTLARLAASTVPLLLIGIAVAWWFGARLTTPLRNLSRAAQGISGGDYDQRVEVEGVDEVATLGTAFNQMADSVANAHEILAERASELADRADQLGEQAAELEMANEALAESVADATRARDELVGVSAELDACLASAPVGFALYDATGRYRRVNASLARLHGIDPESHVGKLPSEVMPDLGEQLERHVTTTLASGAATVNIELSNDASSRGGPTTQEWLASVFPIRTPDGTSLGVGSVVTDLTAYKQLERQLLQSQKMEAVGRLAGGVAHDFNNILTAISGFGQFVLTELEQHGHAGAKSDIEQVLAAAERGGALTRQLLAFSRQQVLQPRVLDLNAVVTSLGPMLARLIGTDIQMRTISSPQLSMVKADPNQMEQVLLNLVVNARDAMPLGGTVTIETADVELDESYTDLHSGVTPGRYVMLAVTDNGVGMDTPTRARVFDPFFTTKQAGKGTGLGLSTVYGIVKQSGGNVELYSEPGKGTSFKVYLPRCVEHGDDAVAHRAPVVVPNGRARILLVDDDPHVSAAARRTLERAGYAVTSAANGQEGLRQALSEAEAPDLLITDLVMPEMGGRELARRLLEARPTVRLLYTSGYTAQAMNQQAILEPGDAFLGKPFTPDALLRRVDEILRAVPA